jgi:hypothetical protein
VDPAARARFLADPEAEARRAGLTPEQCRALAAIDRTGLEMAARSFARKRSRSPRFATEARGLPGRGFPSTR